MVGSISLFLLALSPFLQCGWQVQYLCFYGQWRETMPVETEILNPPPAQLPLEMDTVPVQMDPPTLKSQSGSFLFLEYNKFSFS